MNKILILDAAVSDIRVMSSLLSRAGYDPLGVDSIAAGKVEVAKLPPGAVIVTAMRLSDGTAKEFINWLKTEGFSFPVIAIVDNLGKKRRECRRHSLPCLLGAVILFLDHFLHDRAPFGCRCLHKVDTRWICAHID